MIFEIKNLGSIEHAEIEMGELTVIGGKNNTGKTYITYAVWGWLKEVSRLFLRNYDNCKEHLRQLKLEERIKNGEKEEISVEEFRAFYKNMHLQLKEVRVDWAKLFSTNKSNFKESEIILQNIDNDFFIKPGHSNVNNEYINISQGSSENTIEVKYIKNNIEQIYLSFYLYLCTNTIFGESSVFGPFLLTAQRDAIWLFQKEIDKHRNDVLQQILKKDNSDILFNNPNIFFNLFSDFAQPIESNIDFIRDLDSLEKNGGDKYVELSSFIENMMGINYTAKDNRLFLVDKKTNIAFPAYLGSTSVRSLAMLHLWLKSTSTSRYMLMIDEPEMSLHPENQVKIARLLVRLVNAGFRVWITTHSDYIVKELNNCLMLANDFEGKAELMAELGYTQADILKADDLRAYIAHSGSVERIQTDSFGMMTSAFDETISQINNAAEKLSEAISEKQTK